MEKIALNSLLRHSESVSEYIRKTMSKTCLRWKLFIVTLKCTTLTYCIQSSLLTVLSYDVNSQQYFHFTVNYLTLYLWDNLQLFVLTLKLTPSSFFFYQCVRVCRNLSVPDDFHFHERQFCDFFKFSTIGDACGDISWNISFSQDYLSNWKGFWKSISRCFPLLRRRICFLRDDRSLYHRSFSCSLKVKWWTCHIYWRMRML